MANNFPKDAAGKYTGIKKKPKKKGDYPGFPADGMVRIAQIVGDPARKIPPFVPVSRQTWLDGVKSGQFPKPIKLGPRTTVWRVSEVRALMGGG